MTKKRAGRALTWQPHDWERHDDRLRELFAAGHLLAWIGEQLGVSKSAVGDRVAKLGLIRDREIEKRHGIPARWQEGCRCDVCKPAMQAYKRAEREKAIERGPITHGDSGYGVGCRCDVCTNAMLARNRGRQYRTRPTATAHGERWSRAEDEAALDTSRRIEDIAAELGRTYSAIDNRRRFLQRRRGE